MNLRERVSSSRAWLLCIAGIVFAGVGAVAYQSHAADSADASAAAKNVGPYNVSFLAGGIGLSKPLAADSSLLAENAAWSLSGWLRPALSQSGTVIVAAVGEVGQRSRNARCRCLLLEDGMLVLELGGATQLRSTHSIATGRWHAIAATYDGVTARLYLDGREIGARPAKSTRASPILHLAPLARGPGENHFGGDMADVRLSDSVLTVDDIGRLHAQPPGFDLMVFHRVGEGWPWQQRAWRGLQQPQDAWTLPRAITPPDPPQARPTPTTSTALHPRADGVWTLGAWRLIEAPKIAAQGAQISQPRFDDQDWYAATVPGTVLTTLIDRGVYPDPDHGLNNMAIPESLARQKYWYRSSFDVPAQARGRNFTLTFKGINYAAEIWLNGTRLGEMKGAFIRGVFDVTRHLQAGGRNALAVLVSPPPHPGIPHEESISAGPGENGGNLAIDGPTFIASEGWDWIPAIRDRNIGIWQDVELRATNSLRLLDAQVITRLPLPKTDTADVEIAVPVLNLEASSVTADVEASFDTVRVKKTLMLPPGKSTVNFNSREFPQLRVHRPRLWWPNGYGPAHLYDLTLQLRQGNGEVSDGTTLRFGIRHITYELSLFDREGRLRRVEVDPAQATPRGEKLVDIRHEAIKQTPNGWGASLTRAGETSSAVRPIATESLTPHLAIRVNGVPIAVRGGNWGTDDSRKRIARARLEPYFRLHQAANLNTIRNWVGQNTQDVFYELADEYGLLVLNDFWASTQDFQVEPQDPALFLDNARDVIERYRNHPSIALWFGRNEGVPQPILNEGLDDLVAALDGTRFFTGSSNNVNLQGSGPYNYRPPVQYFTELARGFSVEVGTPSLSTLESLQASIPAADRWPLSDTLAYHDWHFGGNGDVATFMSTLAAQFGAGASLADFERKAQMLNYVTYRALFEGFHAGLWTHNSGRLLWMTHPSWPSNSWQIYSSDYDTHAAYYGVKKACEPLHVQMNLPDFRLAVVNTTQLTHRNLSLRSRILSLDNRVLAEGTQRLTAAVNAVTTLAPLDLGTHLNNEELVLVVLTLSDAKGARLSENLYWQGRSDASYQRLNTLASQPVSMEVQSVDEKDAEVVNVTLSNRGNVPALAAKLTMLNEQGDRVLPVYYSDNYVSLLAGESKTIQVRCPSQAPRCARVSLRGWNVNPIAASVASAGQLRDLGKTTRLDLAD